MSSGKDLISLPSKLDGRASDLEWDAVFELRRELGDEFPIHLLKLYEESKSWKEKRLSCPIQFLPSNVKMFWFVNDCYCEN